MARSPRGWLRPGATRRLAQSSVVSSQVSVCGKMTRAAWSTRPRRNSNTSSYHLPRPYTHRSSLIVADRIASDIWAGLCVGGRDAGSIQVAEEHRRPVADDRHRRDDIVKAERAQVAHVAGQSDAAPLAVGVLVQIHALAPVAGVARRHVALLDTDGAGTILADAIVAKICVVVCEGRGRPAVILVDVQDRGVV